MDLSIFEVGGHVPFPGLVASPAVVYSEAKVFIKLVNGFKFDYKVRTSLNLLVSFFLQISIVFQKSILSVIGCIA